MSDERQITSDDTEGALTEGTVTAPDPHGSDAGEDADAEADRIERLRALLTAPIRIPESESASADENGTALDGDDEYPAPSVDIPPHVRAAAEAAAHAGAPEPARTRTGKKRRTWADAFLDSGKRDLGAAGGDAAAQLLARLDELDRRTGEDIALVRARANEAADAADEARRGVEDVRADAAGATESAGAAAARLDAVEKSLEKAAERNASAILEVSATTSELRDTLTARRDEIAELTTSLEAARKAVAEAGTAASAAREAADAAARKAGTAMVVGVIGIVAALAAVGLAFLP